MSGENLTTFLCCWRIKNFSCLFYKFKTPLFRVEGLKEGQWSLCLRVKHHTKGLFWKTVKKYVVCQLSLHESKNTLISDKIALNFWYELTNADDDFVRASEEYSHIFSQNRMFSEACELIELEDLMKEMSSSLDDTLILRCYMSSSHGNHSVLPTNSFVTCCEIETTTHIHVVPYEWHFKFRNIENWYVIKIVCFTNVVLEITFMYRDDEIQIEILSEFVDNREYLFLCEMAILNSSGTKIVSYEHSEVFHCNNKIWQYPSFFSKEHLDKAECFTHEEIRIKLRLTHPYSSTINYFEDSKKNKNIEFKKNGSECDKNAQQGMRHLLLNGQFSDVQFRVHNEIFPAHRLVLASVSPIFANFFKQDMASNFIDITNVDKNTFKLFLEYIYTSEIREMNEETALNLLILANKYQVLPLVEKCSTFLKSVLSLRNVCKILSIANEGNHETLKFAAVEYIVENSKKLLSSPEWLQLRKINETLTSVILHKVSKRLAVTDKGESALGSSKEVHLPTVNTQKKDLGAGSSNDVHLPVNFQKNELGAGSSKKVSKQSEASCWVVPEVEGRQLNFK